MIDDPYPDESLYGAEACAAYGHCREYKRGEHQCCECGERPAGWYPQPPTYHELEEARRRYLAWCREAHATIRAHRAAGMPLPPALARVARSTHRYGAAPRPVKRCGGGT